MGRAEATERSNAPNIPGSRLDTLDAALLTMNSWQS